MQSTSTKTLLILSILIMLGAVGILGYEAYVIRQEDVTSAELANQVAQNAKGEQVSEDLRAIQMNSVDQITTLNKLAVSQDTLVPFLELLEQTGRALNLTVKVNAVSADPGRVASSTAKKLHVTLEAVGNWSNSLAFVHSIESLPYRVMIDQAVMTTDLAVPGEATTDHPWKSSYTLSLYSF